MFLRSLDRAEETLIASLMAAATLVIFVAVVHRFGIGAAADLSAWARAHDLPWLFGFARSLFKAFQSVNLTWAQELCIYLFVWMAKFGAAYGVRTGIHVGVDVLVNRLPEGQRRVCILFGLLAGAFFTVIVGSLGATFVWEMAHTDQISADLELPMWLVYLAVPAGSYLMCFRFLQVAWRFAHGVALPHHDYGHVEGLEKEAHP
ncbi:TRAP transporter small permease [Dongia sp.]|uniref:TRAP transporter small permease n=1 Tax=Dongia sp. TaxID=1977262 RepID=UPI0035B48ABC